MTTQMFEDTGHIVGIPDRFLKIRDVSTALIESGARVAVAIAGTVAIAETEGS